MERKRAGERQREGKGMQERKWREGRYIGGEGGREREPKRGERERERDEEGIRDRGGEEER